MPREVIDAPPSAVSAIVELLQVPAHLRPEAEAWPVVDPGLMVKCPLCGGTKKLALASGGEVDCGRCEGDGRVWTSHFATSDNPLHMLGLEVYVNADRLRYKVVFKELVLRYDITAADLFPTKAEAVAECERRNAKKEK